MQEIKLTIGTDGKVNIDVAGVKGPACKDLTKSIEAALGKTESVEKKPEFYQQQAAGAKQQISQAFALLRAGDTRRAVRLAGLCIRADRSDLDTRVAAAQVCKTARHFWKARWHCHYVLFNRYAMATHRCRAHQLLEEIQEDRPNPIGKAVQTQAAEDKAFVTKRASVPSQAPVWALQAGLSSRNRVRVSAPGGAPTGFSAQEARQAPLSKRSR